MTSNAYAKAQIVINRQKHNASPSPVREKTTRVARRAAKRSIRSFLMCPIRSACCFCTSMQGVLALMRSETTREFALAVVVGNAFEVFIGSVSRDIITPCIFALPIFTNDGWVFGFTGGTNGFVLVGGDYYRQPNITFDPFDLWDVQNQYPSNAAAEADNARFVNISSFFTSTLTFVLTLLNIYWFFGCVAQTERAENFVYGLMHDATDAAKLAGEKAAAAAHVDVAKLEKKLKILQDTVELQEASLVSMGRDIGEEAVGEEAAPAAIAGADMRRSVSFEATASEVQTATPEPGAQLIPRPGDSRTIVNPGSVSAGAEPSAAWLPLVHSATSVERGMKALYEAAPLTFYLQGETIRRQLEYKFTHLTASTMMSTATPLDGPRPAAQPHRRHRTKVRRGRSKDDDEHSLEGDMRT